MSRFNSIKTDAGNSTCFIGPKTNRGFPLGTTGAQNMQVLLNTNSSGDHGVPTGVSVIYGSNYTSVAVDGASYASGDLIDASTSGSFSHTVQFVVGGLTFNFTTTKTINSDTLEAFTVVAGAVPTPTSSSSTPTAKQKAASARRSAGAAIGRASNSAQTFVTQTQIQNRLLGNGFSSNQQANLNGESNQSSPAGIGQLAMAYGESVKRPAGKMTWHSKDIINDLRAKQSMQLRNKENAARAGLGIAQGDSVTAPLAFTSPIDVWAAGGYTKVDSSKTGNEFDGGLLFARTGIDYLVSPNLLVGTFFGYDKGETEFSSLSTDIDSTGLIGGGYFGLKLAPRQTGLPMNLILDGQFSYGRLDYDITDIGNATTGSFDADRLTGSMSLTAVFLSQAANGGTIRWLPKVGLNYVSEDQDGYTDSGSNVIDSQKITLGQLTFGTQVFLPVTNYMDFFTRVEGQWDFDGIGLITTSTGGTYKPDEFGVVIGAGLSANISESVTFKLEGAAEGLGRSDYDQFTGSARIDFRF